jgi:peptide/nickel transport system substrate-binding protein
MRKRIFYSIISLVLIGLMAGALSPASAESATPVKGGVLRGMRATFPQNIGYLPEWKPAEWINALPWAERLIQWSADGGYVPNLAESWDIDVANKTIVFKLVKGIKFSDGTPFNAERLKANYEYNLKCKRITGGEYITSIDILDPYTLRLNLSEITSAAMLNYGFNMQIVSVEAIEKNGADWARKHGIGTGPFIVTDFQQDISIKYVRNENYWRPGMPYLDGMDFEIATDPLTARMKMEAGEMDIWMDVSDIKMALDLEKKGFKLVWGRGMMYTLIPNSNKPKDPDSPLVKKKVREAIEYAINRPALANVLGFGQFEPLTQIVPSFSPAYNKGFDLRPYNPEKAKQLLAEAGYPNGFSVSIMTVAQSRDAATAVQNYLADVGIKADIDIADFGRYAAALFGGKGWDGLALAASGIHPPGTDLYQHWGPRPNTFRFDFIKKSPEYLEACETALQTFEEKAMHAAMQKAVRIASEDAMIIPLYRSANPHVMQPYVHTEYPMIHGIQWNAWEDWMDKH